MLFDKEHSDSSYSDEQLLMDVLKRKHYQTLEDLFKDAPKLDGYSQIMLRQVGGGDGVVIVSKETSTNSPNSYTVEPHPLEPYCRLHKKCITDARFILDGVTVKYYFEYIGSKRKPIKRGYNATLTILRNLETFISPRYYAVATDDELYEFLEEQDKLDLYALEDMYKQKIYPEHNIPEAELLPLNIFQKLGNLIIRKLTKKI